MTEKSISSKESLNKDSKMSKPDVKEKEVKEEKNVKQKVFKAYSSIKRVSFDPLDWKIFLLLTVLSLITRFYKIEWSSKVVWDEAHFGKFGSYYLKRQFYHDVHPPLGKILVGFAGALAGYDGKFDFKSGVKYTENVPYHAMRLIIASFGVAIVPIAYATSRFLRFSRFLSVLAASMVLFDNATLTISRFILLDSILLFFTSTSVLAVALFHNERSQPFSRKWWKWLYFVGLSIGCVSSVKWIGLFTIAIVGIYTIDQLYEMWGDLSIDLKTYAKHWLARIIFLILFPIIVYVGFFGVHFSILNRSGPGDANMPSLFQAGLRGNTMSKSPLNIAYGSVVTIKNNARGGGLLHSHIQAYPVGSFQQQITCYHHKDKNNNWIFAKPDQWPKEDDEIEFVKNGDLVRLIHESTKRKLHSHPVKAPITTSDWEVSGYGSDKFGDDHDLWIVEIVDDMKTSNVPNIRAITTRFRLRHKVLGCLLRADNIHLPSWGFKQTEVTCDKKNRTDSTSNIWNVENHTNAKLPPPPPSSYKSNFFKDVLDVNVAMWNTNNALVPDEDKNDILSSDPHEWPLALAGLRMCGWGDKDIKYYLLANPVVWWFSTASILSLTLLTLIYVIRLRRGINNWTIDEWEQFLFPTKFLVLGWAIHYLPFFIMGRVTYLHHYFPALYFAILATAHLLDHFRRCYAPRLTNLFAFLLFCVTLGTFFYFAPFSFGFDYPAKELANRRWISSWNIYNQ